jgi:hypothetical protein
MYVRNYSPGLDVRWEDFFRTEDKNEVESYCRAADIKWEWKPDGGLRTMKVCPAVARHPRSGEEVFFNQLQAHHISCVQPVVRESMMKLFKEEELPRNVYYGDGERISDQEVEHIRDVYRRAEVSFSWQEGDILMIDNMLVAHGRKRYEGARKVIVAMGEIVYLNNISESMARHLCP